MERAVKIQLPPPQRPGLRVISGDLDRDTSNSAARAQGALRPEEADEHICLSALLREVLAEYRDEPDVLTLP